MPLPPSRRDLSANPATSEQAEKNGSDVFEIRDKGQIAPVMSQTATNCVTSR